MEARLIDYKLLDDKRLPEDVRAAVLWHAHQACNLSALLAYANEKGDRNAKRSAKSLFDLHQASFASAMNLAMAHIDLAGGPLGTGGPLDTSNLN